MRLYAVVAYGMAMAAVAGGMMTYGAVVPAIETRAAVQRGTHAAHMTQATLAAATRISAERGPTNGVLGADLPLPPERIKALADARKATDDALSTASRTIDGGGFTGLASAREALLNTERRLTGVRGRVDGLAARPRDARSSGEVHGVVADMIAVIPELIPALNAMETALVAADPALTNFVTIARLATDLRDIAGQLGSVFTPALVTQRPLAASEIAQLDRLSGTIDALDHHMRLAYTKTGEDVELRKALADIDQHYLGAGRALVARVAATGRAGGDYGMTAADFAKLYVPEMASIVELRDATMRHIFERLDQLRRSNALSLWMDLSAAAVAALGILAAFAVVVLRVLRPLALLSRSVRRMAAGETEIGLPAVARDDEVGELVGALKVLQTAVRERDAQAWIKTEVAAIAERLQGADDFAAFAQTLFSRLSQSLPLLYGAMYLADESRRRFVRVGGYAIDHTGEPCVFRLGDGVVGRVAAEGRPAILAESHELRVAAGAGTIALRHVVVLPVIHQDAVTAVLEVAPTAPPDALQTALLDAMLPIVAMNTEILAGTMEMRRLLERPKEAMS